MSKMSSDTVQDIIKSVGLAPKKAVYLVELSKKLVSDHNSTVPASYKALESLPGVGHKTASVMMSQSFGHPAIAVDTHVHRLANRWGLSNEKNVDKVQQDLMAVFPEETWNKLHLQMIYFGREFCTAKDHTPSGCPICSLLASTSQLPATVDAPSIRAQFSAAKKSKGIVYYSDRIEQLAQQGDLVLGTSSPAPLKMEKFENIPLGAVSLLENLKGKKEKTGTKRQRSETTVAPSEAVAATKRKSNLNKPIKAPAEKSKTAAVAAGKRVTTRSARAKQP